jgi:hypothetical protein
MSTNAESVQDSAGEAGTSWWLPIIAAVATFMTGIAFAWSKDFAVFLLLIFVYLPAAAFTCIGLFVWAVIKRNSRHGRAIFMASSQSLWRWDSRSTWCRDSRMKLDFWFGLTFTVIS